MLMCLIVKVIAIVLMKESLMFWKKIYMFVKTKDMKRFIECVPLTVSYHLYFLRISKVSNMLRHGQCGEFKVENATLHVHIPCSFICTYTLLAFFCCFSSNILCYYHFYFFF